MIRVLAGGGTHGSEPGSSGLPSPAPFKVGTLRVRAILKVLMRQYLHVPNRNLEPAASAVKYSEG